ncbi:hypothetical protein K492DRAFT_199844 [Lichtheimia hyalospora FSU 10163]|nr:hypothetical protein K492DRAFT_199844 [Lichtheimia hyalospora FSU 10163]
MSFYQPYPPQQYWSTNAAAPPMMQQQPMFMQHAFQPQPYLYSPPLPSPTMGYYFQPIQQHQQPPQPQPLIQQQQRHRMPSRCHSAEVLVSKSRMSRPLVPPGHHYPQMKAGNTTTLNPSMATIAEEHRRSLADDNVPLAVLASRSKNQESGSGKQRRSISYSNLRTHRSSSPNRLVRVDPSCSNMMNARHVSVTTPNSTSGPPSLSSSRFSSSNSDATSSVGETSSIASSSCPPKLTNKPSIAKRLMNRLSRTTSTTNIQQHH